MELENNKLRLIKGIKLTRDEFEKCCRIESKLKEKKFDNIWQEPLNIVSTVNNLILEEFGLCKCEKLKNNPNFNQEQLSELICYAFRFMGKRPLLLLFISKDNKYSFIDESRIEAFGEKGLFEKPSI